MDDKDYRNIGHADDVPQFGQTTATNRRQTSKVKSRGHELWIHTDKLADTRGQSCGHTRTTLRTLADKVADKLVDTRTKLRTCADKVADKLADTRGQSCAHTRTKLRTLADKVVDTCADKLVDACGQSWGRTRTKWRTLWFRTVRFGFQTLGIFGVSLNFGSTV